MRWEGAAYRCLMFVIGTAGHVDHGKSALIEALTGVDPDRLAEEKRRGLTIDLGFAELTLPSGQEVGLIDVPGHERFIRNMLAGAGGTSACLFVVAANEGWMPQSSEHLSAIHLLGIDTGVIALTKADTVDASELDAIRREVRRRVANTTLSDVEIVSCSARSRIGLDALENALDRALEDHVVPPAGGRPRLWVDRSFSMAGAGTVVTGTLTGGTLHTGDEVEVLGSEAPTRARVRRLQSHNRDHDSIEPGRRAAINLAGLDRDRVGRGDCVVLPGGWRAGDRFNALIRVLEPSVSGHSYDLTSKGSHLLYIGTAEVAVRIRMLDTERASGGDEVPAQLYPSRPLPLAPGDRFVLRDAGPGATFGGGVVVDPLPPLAKARDAGAAALVRALSRSRGADTLRVLLDAEGELALDDVRRRTSLDEIPDGAPIFGGRLFSFARADSLAERARGSLDRHHQDFPLERGMHKNMLAKLLELNEGATDDLLARDPLISVEGPLVRLRSHAVAITKEQAETRDALVARLDAARFAPPPIAEIDADPSLLNALEDSGELVRIADFYLTTALIDEMRIVVTSAIVERGEVTVAEIRDLLQTTRKYALPLCGWLDQMGVTRRIGDVRVLGPKA